MSFLNGLSQSIDNSVSFYKENFNSARDEAFSSHGRFNIGTYRERSQHFILKKTYEPDTHCHEVPYCGYIADIKNDHGIVEIQTSGFVNMRLKLGAFLENSKVKIVYPCPMKRRISWTDPLTGETNIGRYCTYPKRIYKLLPELLRIFDFIDNENLSIDIVITSVTENRLLDGYGPDKKQKATKTDTVPDEIIDIITLNTLKDISGIMPFTDGEELTNSKISKKLGLSRRNLWMSVKLLESCGIIEKSGKNGNTIIYRYDEGVIKNEEVQH